MAKKKTETKFDVAGLLKAAKQRREQIDTLQKEVDLLARKVLETEKRIQERIDSIVYAIDHSKSVRDL